MYSASGYSILPVSKRRVSGRADLKTYSSRHLLRFVVLKLFDLSFQSADFPLDSVQTVADTPARTNPEEKVAEAT